ncbi:copper(I)-binding protein [Bradyrhizobium sp. LB7.2]
MQIGTLTVAATACAVLLASLMTAPSARAEDVKAGDLVISQPWARATPGGAKIGGPT